MPPEYKTFIAGALSLLGLFFVTTVGLWALWTLIIPGLGGPQISYFKFAGLYILIRGLMTPIGKSQ